MGQMHKICKNNTSVTKDGEDTSIVLHKTEVVRFNDKKIVLNSGGWRTVTTKARMNQVSNQHNLGYSVFQNAKNWFVSFKNETIPYEDGMELER